MSHSLFFTGSDWAAIYLCTSSGVWCYCLFNDWISMDCHHILLVSIFYVLHSLVLHLLWHDVCGCDTNTPNCFHRFRGVLWDMEPVFWICDPKNCKCCWLLIIFLKLGFFSTRPMLMTYTTFFSFRLYLDNFRGFLCGGDGTTGYVQQLGLYMDLLHHSLEIWRTRSTQVQQWKILWKATLVLDMTFWEWLQLWLWDLQCSLHLSLPLLSGQWISKSDRIVSWLLG